MEKISNKEHYEKYGYFVIPQAFTKEEMQGIRETIKQVFAQVFMRQFFLYTDYFFRTLCQRYSQIFIVF
jgi:hypothetical protein